MNPATPTLGVVIPTIGDRPEIRRLLLSIVHQRRPVQQVRIVVDGRDTRLVGSIVADLGGELEGIGVQILATEADREPGSYLADTGYGVAVNTGLETLNVDLVAFLDDDDEILPTHFENLERALDPDSGRGVAYSRVLVVSTTGQRRFFQDGPLPSGKFSTYVMIGSHPVLLPSTLIHRSAMDVVGSMDETLDRKADTDMLIRLARAAEISAVDEATYVYYRNPHGTDVREQTLREMALLIRKHHGSMTRRERLLSWDALVRSASRANMPDVSREAAHEAVAQFWPNPPSFMAGLYLRIRRWQTPAFLRRLVSRDVKSVT